MLELSQKLLQQSLPTFVQSGYCSFDIFLNNFLQEADVLEMISQG